MAVNKVCVMVAQGSCSCFFCERKVFSSLSFDVCCCAYGMIFWWRYFNLQQMRIFKVTLQFTWDSVIGQPRTKYFKTTPHKTPNWKTPYHKKQINFSSYFTILKKLLFLTISASFSIFFLSRKPFKRFIVCTRFVGWCWKKNLFVKQNVLCIKMFFFSKKKKLDFFVLFVFFI
jgi:hypothetical protein